MRFLGHSEYHRWTGSSQGDSVSPSGFGCNVGPVGRATAEAAVSRLCRDGRGVMTRRAAPSARHPRSRRPRVPDGGQTPELAAPLPIVEGVWWTPDAIAADLGRSGDRNPGERPDRFDPGQPPRDPAPGHGAIRAEAESVAAP